MPTGFTLKEIIGKGEWEEMERKVLKDKEFYYRIVTLKATFGITIRNNLVVKTAPYGKFMLGWTFQQVQEYMRNHQGKMEGE